MSGSDLGRLVTARPCISPRLLCSIRSISGSPDLLLTFCDMSSTAGHDAIVHSIVFCEGACQYRRLCWCEGTKWHAASFPDGSKTDRVVHSTGTAQAMEGRWQLGMTKESCACGMWQLDALVLRSRPRQSQFLLSRSSDISASRLNSVGGSLVLLLSC